MGIRLEKIHLHNFKCYDEHIVHFNPSTIVVGPNNAGKTTVVESLRILGLATARFKKATSYTYRPTSLEAWLPSATKGLKISAKVIDIDLERVFHRYGDPPAIIEAVFSDDIKISIYISSETDLFAVYFYRGKPVGSKVKVNQIGVPDVRVLPQITPLLKNEQFVTAETLERNRFSKRKSGNFRNSIYAARNDPSFLLLQDMIEKTWGRMRIDSVEKSIDNYVYLNMRDQDYVTEVYYMGHGIQMWLQTLWFIVTSGQDSIVVLDEPDVYMHADLQRKLVRMLKDNYGQMIIATHSIEIMSEVLPENILIIDRKKKESVLADGYPLVQTVLSGMGSVHNIALTRFLRNRNYLYIERGDLNILKIFYDCLYGKESEPLDHWPTIPTEGWSGWGMDVEQIRDLHEEAPSVNVYYTMGKGYHSEEEIQACYETAEEENIRLHVMRRHEISNYVLSAPAIARYICKRNHTNAVEQVLPEIEEMLSDICNSYKGEVIRQIGKHLIQLAVAEETDTRNVISRAYHVVENAWATTSQILEIVPGNAVLQRLSDECKFKYGVGFNALQIASEMNRSEIDTEMLDWIERIKKGQ